MNILLVNPPYTRLRGSGQSAFFPLGLGYLAGVLAAAGFQPMILNAENPRIGEAQPQTSMREVFTQRAAGHRRYLAALADDSHYVWQEFRQVLAEFQPAVVGISALSIQFGAAAKMAEIVKGWRADCPVVFGGHHATYLPEDSLAKGAHFDVVVLGEGEQTFLELCQAYAAPGQADLAAIPGLAWRQGTAVAFSGQRALIENLDALPFPRRDLIFFPETYQPVLFASLIYGRGCPWRCRFCSSKRFWSRRTRMRSPQNCLAEISHLKERYGLDNFMFWDDAFTVNRATVLDFCAKTAESALDFTFSTATRCDLVDEELVGALARAGCVRLNLGVESGSPRVVKMINKDLDFEVLRRAVALIRRKRIALSVFFMAGFPGETREDLAQTFALIKELKADMTSFNIFDPMPGSELYQECQTRGLLPADPDWRNFPLWPDAHYADAIPPDEFTGLVWEISDYLARRDESILGKFKRNLPLLTRNPSAFMAKAVRALSQSFAKRCDRSDSANGPGPYPH